MQHSALVVIDLQNDITKNYKEIIEKVNTAIPVNCWKNAFGMLRRRAKTAFVFCVPRGANGSFSRTQSF